LHPAPARLRRSAASQGRRACSAVWEPELQTA
jgi:hypothetical protein